MNKLLLINKQHLLAKRKEKENLILVLLLASNLTLPNKWDHQVYQDARDSKFPLGIEASNLSNLLQETPVKVSFTNHNKSLLIIENITN